MLQKLVGNLLDIALKIVACMNRIVLKKFLIGRP